MSESNLPTPENSSSDPIEQAKAQARQAAATVRDAANEAMRDMRERGEVMAGDLKVKATDLKQQVEVYVREKPTQAVLIAAGAGFVLGLLIRR